jgi:hypothetical protein
MNHFHAIRLRLAAIWEAGCYAGPKVTALLTGLTSP